MEGGLGVVAAVDPLNSTLKLIVHYALTRLNLNKELEKKKKMKILLVERSVPCPTVSTIMYLLGGKDLIHHVVWLYGPGRAYQFPKLPLSLGHSK